MEKLAEGQLKKEEALETWRQGAAAAEQRERSRSAYLALSAQAARELLESEFAKVLEQSEVSSLVDRRQVLDYVDDHTALVDGPGDRLALAESTLPLVAISDDGTKRPVDLSLQDKGDHFEADNPLVDVSLPERLGAGISLAGADGLGIELAGADPTSQAMPVGEGSVFYPNAGQARDLLVSTQPTGIELSTQIRSPGASEIERYSLDLPEGAALRELPDGSIAIVRDEQPLGRISAPVAIDAQGQEVPVSIRAEGSSFVVEADFKGGDYALPILIDPIVELYAYQAGGFSTALWPVAQTPGSPFYACPGADPNVCNWLGGRIWIYAPTGSYPAASNGTKSWTVPNGTANPDSTTAWIESVTFGNTYFSGNANQPAAPFFAVGIWNPRISNWNALYTAFGNQSFSGSNIALTPSGTAPGPVDDSQQIQFFLADFTGSPTTHSGTGNAYADSATINLTDPEAPSQTLSNNIFPSGWVNSGTYGLDVAASDPGLGVQKIQLYRPTIGGTVDLGEEVDYEVASEKPPAPQCTGGRLAKCNPTMSQHFDYGVAAPMAEGRNKLFIKSWDPLGGTHYAQSTSEVRVDRSGPALELGGSLPSAAGSDLDAKTYDLTVRARDGSTESPAQERSGVKDIKVYLDGGGTPVTQLTNGSCSASSCEGELPSPYTVNAGTAPYGPGPHKLEIKSTDFAGNEATKTLNFSVKGNAGVIVTPKSGDTTARRFRLEAERHDPTMTGVTFQYRRPGATGWQPIPAAQLRLDADGTQPSSTLLALDPGGKSPTVTWDVPPTSGINGVDGAVNIRARFEGASGPPAVADEASLFWRLGEPDGVIAADSSGNDRLGTYVAGTNGGLIRSDDGSPSGPDNDGSVDFDGSNDYIRSDYTPFASSGARTFTGWAKRDTDNTLDMLIAGEDSAQTQNSPYLMVGGASGIPARDVRWNPYGSGGGSYPIYNGVWANAWPSPGINVWVHWALVHNASTGVAELFIDGQSKGTRQLAAGYATPNAPLRVGAWPADNTVYHPFDGKLDEVAVYERSLTQSEVQSQMGGIHKGFSQVVPLTLDRDDTTAKHASAPIGPGSVDLLTGNFALTQDDVSIAGYGSDLTLSRTFNSREPGTAGLLQGLGPGWVTSLPVDAAGSDYTGLLETGSPGDPKATVKLVASDSTEILFTRVGAGYEVEPLYTGLTLTDTGGQYVLKDIGGNTTTFYKPSAAPQYVPLKATQTGNAARTTTRFGYEPYSWGTLQLGIRPKFAVAPTPAGVSCTTGSGQQLALVSPLPPGCRVLRFLYSDANTQAPTAGNYGPWPMQLDKVTFEAPNGSAAPPVEVAKYDYYASGYLHAVWDPRITPAPLKTTYGYDTAGHLTAVTPPGENAWQINYQTISGDSNAGRLKSASRAVPGGATATATAVYDVPLSGGSGAPAMTPGDVSQWAQSDAPTDATAIFPPDQNPGTGTPSSYTRATIHYMNRNGDLVNVANPGGEISTLEYGTHRVVESELTAGNRARALASGNPSATADVLETDRVFNADGTELKEEFGPQHQVRLLNGTPEQARQHTTITYDQDRPTGQDYHLPTTQSVGARVVGQSTDVEVRTTKTDYNFALRQPIAVTVDPGASPHLNLVTKLSYDSATGLPTERRLPKANASGTDAYTTRTIYYSAAANSSDPECGGKPEWANLACKELPGGQPGGPAPDLPITTYQYNLWNQVTTGRDDAAGATPDRVTEADYDAAGRPTVTKVTGGSGTAVPAVTTAYSTTTGRATTTSSTAGTITRGYDSIGRQTSYTDADGVASATLYTNSVDNLLSRPTSISDGKGTTTFNYDPTSGRTSSMTDGGVGTFTATYDADGYVTSETLPNQTVVGTTYNSVGEPISRAYQKSSCSLNCAVMSFAANRSIHGQVTGEASYVGTTLHSNDTYEYDAAARLTRAYNWLDGPGCTRRDYAYDADSNRTSVATVAPLSGGACNTTGSATPSTQDYDEADRIIDSGYTYDDFGRTTAVPAADAGGTQLNTTYYAVDQVRTLSQNGVTRTFSLDPTDRVRVRATSGQSSSEVYHYADDSDSPSWIDEGGPSSNWSRFAASIGGSLSAVQRGHGSTTDTVTFELSNLHGDVAAETDTQGVITQTFDADEFGVPQGSLPTSGYGWLGGYERRTQLASGVITMGARVYVPQTGRFLQVDPVSGGSANEYDYANQDPLDQLDLSGEAVYWQQLNGCSRRQIGLGNCRRRWHRRVGVYPGHTMSCKGCSKLIMKQQECHNNGGGGAVVASDPPPELTQDCTYRASKFIPQFGAPRGRGRSIMVRKVNISFTCTYSDVGVHIPFPFGVRLADNCRNLQILGSRNLGYYEKGTRMSGVLFTT